MAIQSQPSRIPEPFAGSGSKNIIPATNATPSASQAASWASGFPPECSQPISAGGCPVPRNDVNGALNQLSQDYAFRQDGGIWEWSALADYDTQRMVRGSDGLIYWSVAQSGPGTAAGAQDPAADSIHAYWAVVPNDDSELVHKSGAETITGTKTFTVPIEIIKDDVLGGGIHVTNPNEDYTSPSTQSTAIGTSYDVNGTQMGYVSTYVNANKLAETIIGIHSPLNQANSVSARIEADGTLCFIPGTTGDVRLGNTGRRWSQLYAGTATINTSDERLKTSLGGIPDAVLDAWGNVDFIQFRMRDSVAAKGEKARLHTGLVAQRVDDAFKTAGLDASAYGFFCHDEWDAEPEVLDSAGAVVRPASPAGEQFSLRYEEALCIEAAYQRRRADRAEARLAALEDRLAAIEAKLSA